MKKNYFSFYLPVYTFVLLFLFSGYFPQKYDISMRIAVSVSLARLANEKEVTQ